MKKIISFLKTFPLLIGSFLLCLTMYMIKIFKLIDFEQILISLMNTKGQSLSGIVEGALYTVIGGIIAYFIFLIPIFIGKKVKGNTCIVLKIRKKELKLKLFPFNTLLYSFIVFICIIVWAENYFGIIDYYNETQTVGTFYEEYYIDPNTVEITFPKEKQNLIYIYLESMETTNASIKNGGAQEKSYIPYLEKMALNYDNFSNTDKLGGPVPIYATTYTVAALVAHTAGIPYRIIVDAGTWNFDYSTFLEGVTNLGDVLEENGYKNYFMLGSEANYQGRDRYFKEHGNYEIFDYHKAVETGKISSDYYEWWGYEDRKLFQYAKEKLLEISKNSEPFNLTILTADTHFIDGYQDETCKNVFKDKYANAIYCSDEKLKDFITWVQKQDFYENTTIIIIGDHLTMQDEFYDNIDENYERSIYNVIINSKAQTTNLKNRRFTTLDMFPTTLSSLGVTIEGDRLGLGTDLYSNTPTLLEELGYDYLDTELRKKSDYYNKTFWKDVYYEMKKDA